MIERWRNILALALLSSLAAGCGLKGPLYLPDEGKEEVAEPTAPAGDSSKQPAAPRPAPQSQKKDRESSSTPGEGSGQSVSPPDPDRPASTPPGR